MYWLDRESRRYLKNTRNNTIGTKKLQYIFFCFQVYRPSTFKSEFLRESQLTLAHCNDSLSIENGFH